MRIGSLFSGIGGFELGLAHERDRARRVVRVFWRIEGWDGCCYIRRDAIAIAKERHGGHWLMCIRRVTARRVAKAGKVSA